MKEVNSHKVRIFKTLLACTGVITVAGAGQVEAGPHQCEVVNGQVIIDHSGNTWVIQATDGAILQCESFDVGLFELVNFLQPSSAARILNYITSATPTHLDGTILATGIVYFVNPAGVMFGQGAVVDVGGIFAAASDLGDPANNMADRQFAINEVLDMDGSGVITFHMNTDPSVLGNVVIDQGAQIHAREIAHFVGKFVENHGVINIDDGGLTTMSAGDTVVITNGLPNSEPKLSVVISGDTTIPNQPELPGVLNTGEINAGTGEVILGAGDLYSLAVRHTGTLEAGTVTMQSAGQGGDIEALADVTTHGDQNYLAREVTFDGEFTTDGGNFNVGGGTATLLAGDTLVDSGGGSITFTGTIDGTTAGMESLTLSSVGTVGTESNAIDLQGNVGNTTALESLSATSTNGDANSVEMHAVTTLGDQDFIADTVTLNSSYVTGGGNFTVDGDTEIGSDTIVTAAGGAITFTGTIDGATSGTESLTLSSVGTAGTESNAIDLRDNVGDTTALESLSATSINGNANSVNLQDVSTLGNQDYTAEMVTLNSNYVTGGGDFTVDGDTVLVSDTSVAAAGGAITFAGAIDGTTVGTESLTLSSVGTAGTESNGIDLQAYVGESTALESLSTTSTGGDQNTVVLHGVATLAGVSQGTGNQDFTADTVTLNSDYVTQGGDFTVNADTVLASDTAIDTTVAAATGGDITFSGTIDGTAGTESLNVMSDRATFKGDIGSTTKLARFETVVGQNVADGETTLIFEGISITVDGDIVLNDLVDLPFDPTTATIGSDGPLTIISINGNFTMGQDQKLTVSSANATVPGTLIVTLKSGGTATLGDITTLNDMKVEAGMIVLRPPTGGGGLDFVAGGAVNFSVVPVGSAEFANPDGQVDASPNKTLATFVQRAFGLELTDGVLVDRSATRPVFATLATAGPSNTDPASAVAGAMPQESELEEVLVAPLLSPVGQLELFLRLRIPAQELRPSPSWVGTAVVWNDAPSTVLRPERVQVQRLQTDLAKQALAAYERLTAAATPSTVKSTILRGWGSYVRAEGRDADPSGFLGYLTGTGHDDEAVSYLQGLYNVRNPVVLMGPTAVELQEFERQFHRDYKPQDMSPEAFIAAIEAAATATVIQ